MSARRQATLRAQWLGQQLRQLRLANDVKLEDAAEYIHRSRATMGRFETGEYPVRWPDVVALLDLYGVADSQRRNALLQLSEDVWQKGWWDGYADDIVSWLIDYVWLESRAESIRTFDVTPVQGLLQTRAYAEAMIRAADSGASDDQVRRWIDLRMDRQQVLAGEGAPWLRVLLDEAVLHRKVGGAATMAGQLRYLSECMDRSNIEVRVLPFDAGAHASPDGAFRILTMPDPLPEVGYVESPAGTIYVETPESDRLASLYDKLWGAALDADETAEWISTRGKELQ